MKTEYLSVREVAETLGVTPRRVQQLIKAGRLEAEKVANALLIRPEALVAVLDRRPGKPSKGKPSAHSVPTKSRTEPAKIEKHWEEDDYTQ